MLELALALPLTAAIVSAAWVTRRRDLLTFQREDLRAQLTAAHKRNTEQDAAFAAKLASLETLIGATADALNARCRRIEENRQVVNLGRTG